MEFEDKFLIGYFPEVKSSKDEKTEILLTLNIILSIELKHDKKTHKSQWNILGSLHVHALLKEIRAFLQTIINFNVLW